MSLIVGVIQFHVLEKNLPQSHLIIIRECVQNGKLIFEDTVVP